MIHKLQKQENKGKKPLIILDNGFVSDHNLTQLKKEGFDYIVVGKKNKRLAYEKDFSSLPFKEILGRKGKTSIKVAIKDEGDKSVVLCHSDEREVKERGMMRQVEKRYLEDLNNLKKRLETGKLKKFK